jgi:hypothetical protein
MNQALHIQATIKLHKENKLIRPIVNWKKSPGYKRATQLAKQLEGMTLIPNAFNITEFSKTCTTLKKVNIQRKYKTMFF